MKKALYTLLILFSTSLTAQEPITLKVNLQKGDKYLVKTTKKFYGSAMKDIVNYETLTVKDVTASVYKVELDINKIVANLNQSGTTVKYDSSLDASQMPQQVKGFHSRFKPALNTVISEDVSKTGKSSNRKKVSGQLNAQMVAQKTNLLELPLNPIKIGTEWSKNTQENNIKITKKYTITNITNNKVFVDMEGVLQRSYTGNQVGEMIGTIELNKKTGVPIKKEIQLEMSVKGQMIKTDVTITFEKI